MPASPLKPLTIGSLGAKALIDAMQGKAPARDPLLDRLPEYAAAGFSAVEDYVGWAVVEPREGEPDFARQLEHRDAAARAGLQYVVYAWLHALPQWVQAPRRFEPFVCLEHAAPIAAPSIFAASTFAWFEHYFALLHEHLGDIDALTIAAPCDYGEVGYPTGLGDWIFRTADAQHGAHEGLWCGDAAARDAWNEGFADRHGPLETATATAESSAALTRFLRASMTAFVDRILTLARGVFPHATLAFKCGFAGEKACFGNDLTALGRVALRHGAQMWSTHGTLPVYFHKRIQTICRTLRVPYVTEGVTERSRAMVLDRLFEDAADGARGFFEFDDTWMQYRETFTAGLVHLRGDDPEVDVALLFHSSQHERAFGQSAPPRLFALCEPLRDLVDYEIVDEDLLDEPAALDRYGVVCVADDGALRPATIERLRAFAARGGLVVIGAPDVLARLDSAAATNAWPIASTVLAFTDRAAATRTPATTLAFGRDDEWHLVRRWHGAERAALFFDAAAPTDRARWTCDRSGLRLALDRSRSHRLEIEVFADARAQPSRWCVRVDQAPTPIALRPGAQRLSLDLPPRPDAYAPVVELEFVGPTFVPAASEPTTDRRDLGILVRTVTLIESGADASTAVAPAVLEADAGVDRLLAHAFVRRGRGGFVLAPEHDLVALAAVVVAATAERARFVPGAVAVPFPRGRHDGIRVARMRDRWLLLNRGDARASRDLPRADGSTQRIDVEPGTIRSVAP